MPLRLALSTILLLMLSPLPGCTKFDLLNATIPPFGYDRTRSIAYGQQPRQTLDVYRPTCTTQPADIVVFFYGGDWQYGEKEGYRFVAQALASRGFIAVLPDYRLYPAVMFPQFVEDGALAVKWTHDHAAEIGGDPQHIYLMGHSAGAHIAAMLTMDPRYLQAVGLTPSVIAAIIGLSGPYDFTLPGGDGPVFGLKPGQDRPADAAEPVKFVTGHEPPMLLIHGTTDNVVAVSNTQSLAAAVRAHGGRVETKYYANKGHVDVVLSLAFPFRWIAPTLADVTAYIHSIDQTTAKKN